MRAHKTGAPKQPQRVVPCVLGSTSGRDEQKRREQQSRRTVGGSKEQQVGAAGTTTAVSWAVRVSGAHTQPAALLWLGRLGTAPG